MRTTAQLSKLAALSSSPPTPCRCFATCSVPAVCRGREACLNANKNIHLHINYPIKYSVDRTVFITCVSPDALRDTGPISLAGVVSPPRNGGTRRLLRVQEDMGYVG